MLVGNVSLSHGRLVPFASIFVEDAVGDLFACDAKIDTGFTEWLGLPARHIDELGLEAVDSDFVMLADNQERRVEVYVANVIWGLQRYSVRVHRVGTMPLIGMSLLQGLVLTMDARHGGAVEIVPATGPVQ